jgi:hypothetical protein
VITLGRNTTNRTNDRSVGTFVTLEIQFYSHILEYYTTLVACTGANWQHCNQATVANGILEIGKADVVRPPDIRRPKRTAPYQSWI